MFQKPAFGSNTSGFGSFNAGTSTASPFGGFKPTTGTSAFGAPPAFGASTSTQPTAGTGLFGASNTTTGLFGNTTAATSAPAFGASTSGFGFGATTSTGGLFGQNNTSTGLFGGTQGTSAFGAKPSGFGFGSTATTGTTGSGLFGSTPTTGTSLFGQQTNTLGSTGLFANNTGAFGQQAPTGTAHVKYNPAVGTDVVVKSGTSQNVIIKHHCITCMKEYENKSLEELRLEDYVAGRKGQQATGVFGGFQSTTENKPLFSGGTFGQPATTSAPSVFGGGALNTTSGFGQNNTFSFGSNAQNTPNTTPGLLFGAAKPTFGTTATTGTGLFGQTTTQPSTFGTNTSTFGFGSNTQNQSTNLFGPKPAGTGFGTTQQTGFGGFGTGNTLFAPKPQQPAAPSFGSTAPAFGSLSTGFGTTTSTSGGMFGQNNTFGKPTTQQPNFGFGNTQQNTLGGGLGGANAFGAKQTTAAPFGTLGGSMFQQPTNNTFRTGLDSGLGGGMFNSSTLGGNTLGLGMNANNTSLGNNSLTGASAGGNVHEQILTMAARPYGDSPLFKDLLPDSSTTAEDVLKPTNPAAVKAVLESSGGYKLSSPGHGIKLFPRPALHHDKKSLFDGLEEADSSLEDKLSLKPSRKRLVLRQSRANDAQGDGIEQNNNSNRSPNNQEQHRSDDQQRRSPQTAAERTQPSFDNNNSEINSDRHGSWLGSPKVTSSSWNGNEKPVESEPTPRLYPNLDKELPAQLSERRASWLTTKPLRKPLTSNPESAENSVRELGIRQDRSMDKENIDTLSVSEEENVPPREAPPHPTGVKLTRPGYYTIPSLDEMIKYMRPDGSCVVPHLTIGRKNYGNVYYDCEIDVAGLDLDALVHFLNKEVIVYPEDAEKPPVGEGLNRRAIVTLDRIWPRDKTEKRPITEPDRLLKMDYEGKLRRVCDKHDTKFIEYRPQTGSWVFRVEHFSKYGLTDSDEEDEPTPDVLKRQLVNQQLQKASAPVPKPPVTVSSPGLGGLGGPGLGGLGGSSLGGLSGLGAGLVRPDDTLFAMQQTSLNLLNGAGKAFEMDTTEDNADSQSLYSDNRAFGVKSPTSELARLEHRQSHNVQLMKASLYADAELEEDISVSTGDQLVPLISTPAPPPRVETPQPLDITPPVITTDELPMKPLIVPPHTIVLKYHRKVPPFRMTIAGGLGAACIADMAVSRARHSRVGFGPANNIVFPTTYDAITDLPKDGEISELSRYVSGRGVDDWSEPVVARMAIGCGDSDGHIQEALSRYMETLMSMSELDPSPEDRAPRLRVKSDPAARRELLRRLVSDAASFRHRDAKFGVSGVYCHEVWKLCDALWGADLDNDGVAATDVQTVVSQHRKLLEWFKDVVAAATDADLSKPKQTEPDDESDAHSSRVWTLLVGGRILEACKLCKEHGDLNMAVLIAQAAGDPSFRSLVSRQLSQWRECGADARISPHRLASLRLVAGLSSPRDALLDLDWLRALHATARYLCPQVPKLENVIRTYESFFTDSKQDDEDMVDLSILDDDGMGMKYPLPPYYGDYDVISNNGRTRRILDLRYELLRSRAKNSRPNLRPAMYTPDPLDYSLSFLLGVWFGNPSVASITGMAEQLESTGLWHRAVQALAYHPDDMAFLLGVWFGNPSVASITGMAEQLESTGLWHRAVQALAYHPDDMARGHLIRGVVSRHCAARPCPRAQLLGQLRVPAKWVLLARAHRAKYMLQPLLEAELLVEAGEWNAAHKVLLEQLLPDAVLADDLQSISHVVEKLQEAGERHEVSGWETGGQALYHYMHVCEQMNSAPAEALPARLEALRPRLAAACAALHHLPTRTGRQRAARTELGARLVRACAAAGAPRAALHAAAALPPGAAHRALHKITMDLADRASELCIDSANSSPISSHHTAAVQS